MRCDSRRTLHGSRSDTTESTTRVPTRRRVDAEAAAVRLSDAHERVCRAGADARRLRLREPDVPRLRLRLWLHLAEQGRVDGSVQCAPRPGLPRAGGAHRHDTLLLELRIQGA